MVDITVNGSQFTVEVDHNMPLLWVLRDELGLVGTKYSCGIGSCGACKVLIDGVAVQSCSIKVGDVKGEITTIEGIADEGTSSNEVIKTWIDHQVAQCGYCQPGQIMATVALITRHPDPDDATIDREMAGNLCRCGTYPRIREAVKAAAKTIRDQHHSPDNQQTI
jgi:isoquinoline 1-oxidoreductase alpha subunit